jgi:hypothetical protein
MTVRVFVEFKLANHPRLLEGLDAQLPAYMRAQGVYMGIFICIGFDDSARARYTRVTETLSELAKNEPDLFLRAEFIDARRRSGASLRPAGEKPVSRRPKH